MSTQTIPFGKLLPDRAAFRSQGVVSARNVVPKSGGTYGPLRELVPVSTALSARCFGAISARDTSNNVYVYAGDASKLYELAGGSFVDQSKGGGYTLASDDVWEFVVWDKTKRIIATDYTDAVQWIGIGLGASTAFADLFTSSVKPKAKHIAIVGNFLVLGNTNDATDGVRPTRVWWSAFGNEASMDPDAATQCDYEDLASGGWVQRVIGGNEYGLIFQTDMVRTMRYVGGNVIFDLLPINNAPGTPIPNSVIPHKGRVFYIAEDGFFAFENGAVTPIGNGQVDEDFWAEFDVQNKRALSAAIDPVRKLVCWAYPGAGASSSLPNRVRAYKWDEQRWVDWDIDLEWLFRTETQGYTLDGLDSVGTNIDDSSVFSQSLDSDQWKGGSLRFGAFGQQHKLSFFTGANRRATVETGDIQPKDGSLWIVNGVRPLVDGGSAEIAAAARTKLQDVVAYGTSSMSDADGLCPMCVESRYMRFRSSLTSSTSWNHFQGLTLDYELTGQR